jgi:biopolymer transport protein ExbD
MLVSLSMIKNRTIPVRLPATATGAPEEQSAAASISITADGAVFFDKEEVDRAGLAARLARLRASVPDPKVLIHGDEGARFGEAIEVLDQVREEGISKVSIETRARARDAEP